jgi:ABC-2 type transport system ATP-binding protein
MKLSDITKETAMYPTIDYDLASAQLTGAGLQARDDALAGAVRYRAGQTRLQLTENCARCEALFASGQQRSDVDGLSFTVHPGRVTGFLGPNGAGKSTTMRVILGLDAPTAGRATIGGQPYARLRCPLHQVGALLDAGAVHGGRTARNHLLALAASNGIGARRVDEVLGLVGLDSAAGRRVRGFSLGMRQRLGIAAALLGDPGVLMFDEPVNGLDPEGLAWIRGLFQQLAAEGRTVFVSSHLMSEMADDRPAPGPTRGGRSSAHTLWQSLALTETVIALLWRTRKPAAALAGILAGYLAFDLDPLLLPGVLFALLTVAATRGRTVGRLPSRPQIRAQGPPR